MGKEKQGGSIQDACDHGYDDPPDSGDRLQQVPQTEREGELSVLGQSNVPLTGFGGPIGHGRGPFSGWGRRGWGRGRENI